MCCKTVFFYKKYVIIHIRHGGEVVTPRSAKPLCAGSIPVRASSKNFLKKVLPNVIKIILQYHKNMTNNKNDNQNITDLSSKDNNSCPKDGSCCGGECVKEKEFVCCGKGYNPDKDEEEYGFDVCNRCDCVCGGCNCKNKETVNKTFWKSEIFIFVSGIMMGIVISVCISFIYKSLTSEDKHNINGYQYRVMFDR